MSASRPQGLWRLELRVLSWASGPGWEPRVREGGQGPLAKKPVSVCFSSVWSFTRTPYGVVLEASLGM